jgi:hypothetical protein
MRVSDVRAGAGLLRVRAVANEEERRGRMAIYDDVNFPRTGRRPGVGRRAALE